MTDKNIEYYQIYMEVFLRSAYNRAHISYRYCTFPFPNGSSDGLF